MGGHMLHVPVPGEGGAARLCAPLGDVRGEGGRAVQRHPHLHGVGDFRQVLLSLTLGVGVFLPGAGRGTVIILILA